MSSLVGQLIYHTLQSCCLLEMTGTEGGKSEKQIVERALPLIVRLHNSAKERHYCTFVNFTQHNTMASPGVGFLLGSSSEEYLKMSIRYVNKCLDIWINGLNGSIIIMFQLCHFHTPQMCNTFG